MEPVRKPATNARKEPSPVSGKRIINKKKASTADTVHFMIRMAVMANGFGLASVTGMLGAMYHAFGDRRLGNSVARDALRVIGEPLLNIRAHVVGRENLAGARPAVFICNHQNIMDIFMLAYMFPDNCGIMAKDSFFYIPLMGQFLWLANNIFIDRENGKSAAKTMQFVASELKRKNIGMFMFPEGTRSYQTDNSLLPFKQGAFRLAIEGQIPLVPIVISTYGDVCDEKRMVYKGGDVTIKVLPPIPTVGKTQSDVKQVMDSTREIMLTTLRQISQPVRNSSKL